jgi:hypothetical protein
MAPAAAFLDVLTPFSGKSPKGFPTQPTLSSCYGLLTSNTMTLHLAAFSLVYSVLRPSLVTNGNIASREKHLPCNTKSTRQRMENGRCRVFTFHSSLVILLTLLCWESGRDLESNTHFFFNAQCKFYILVFAQGTAH